MTTVRNSLAFSLLELIIVMAIIGILMAIAIPSYRIYTRRAHYVEIVQAALPFKLGVEECFGTTEELLNCKAGAYGIPNNITNNKIGLVKNINIKNGGIINITPNEKYGITTKDNYILTPLINGSSIHWQVSGEAIKKGYAN